ncbi:MAG: polysaccharide deacetylase family protein [Deltaproteobacteria bacterium]|nr:polysaccharide deacetylase family protein [Deltaproteobacteria bacterium]
MKKLLGLKIDVDTYVGMEKGVPSLLKVLAKSGFKATFYLSIGPDASGRAMLTLLRNPLFLKKMWRTNAVGLYGLKTALYGTLLPSPLIALSFPDLVKEIIAQGHEVQFHAWDHRRWQDDIDRHSAAWIGEWFARGVEGFIKLTGQAPTSFGAPAWLVDERVMEIVKAYNFLYLSCTRAKEPFIHEGCGLVEIPSDLPCLEEMGAERGADIIAGILQSGGMHVLPLHAEVEGGIRQDWFVKLMEKVVAMDYRAVPLGVIHAELAQETLPIRKYRIAMLAGRAAPCAI